MSQSVTICHNLNIAPYFVWYFHLVTTFFLGKTEMAKEKQTKKQDKYYIGRQLCQVYMDEGASR